MDMCLVKRLSLMLSSAFFIASCSSIGPAEIHSDRNRYNDVIQDTQNQELLRNIVHIRYGESISFLKIMGVTTTYALSRNMAGSLGYTSQNTSGGGMSGLNALAISRSVAANPSISYVETPTISYGPVANAEFINELLTPIALNNLSYLLYGGNHDPNLFFKLVIQSIHGIDNASSLSDMQILTKPQMQKFDEFLAIVNRLIAMDGLKIVAKEVAGKSTVVLHIRKEYDHNADAIKLREMLHVPQRYREIALTEKALPKPNTVLVETRSIYGALVYLSHGIEVPSVDVEAQRVIQYRLPNGQLFDASKLVNTIFKVHTSTTEPMDAYVKVYTHNAWFYIKNSDITTKLTFTFLNNLLILSAGKQLGALGPPPLLTIPTR